MVENEGCGWGIYLLPLSAMDEILSRPEASVPPHVSPYQTAPEAQGKPDIQFAFLVHVDPLVAIYNSDTKAYWLSLAVGKGVGT